MTNERAAFSVIYPHCSQEAFAALIEEWESLLVIDGYGVYHNRVARRQTCLAHLIRTARGLAARQHPDLAACGTLALAELQRLCHMATAPPTGEEWRAWYARPCKWIDHYHECTDDAGRFARGFLREMDSLWVFLAQEGVEPTNNRAERALRFGILWRKRPQGPASTRATAGWSGFRPSAKRVVSKQGRRTPCWWMPSRACSRACNLNSPGLASRETLWHTPCTRAPWGLTGPAVLKSASLWPPHVCIVNLRTSASHGVRHATAVCGAMQDAGVVVDLNRPQRAGGAGPLGPQLKMVSHMY